MSLLLSGDLRMRKTWQPMDPDAAAYITAVEAADGQALEEKVKIAIDNFVLGCKADDIWNAIKASCILAGARTLNGALVPLVGAAPTSFNFVSGDYSRKTGLKADNTNKYLNTNRPVNSEPQNSLHMAVYASETTFVSGQNAGYIGPISQNAGFFVANNNNSIAGFRSNSSSSVVQANTNAVGLIAVNRNNSSSVIMRGDGTSYTASSPSTTPSSNTHKVFAGFGGVGNSTARLAFYSIGEALNLALLDARVTDLINAFGAAIP